MLRPAFNGKLCAHASAKPPPSDKLTSGNGASFQNVTSRFEHKLWPTCARTSNVAGRGNAIGQKAKKHGGLLCLQSSTNRAIYRCAGYRLLLLSASPTLKVVWGDRVDSIRFTCSPAWLGLPGRSDILAWFGLVLLDVGSRFFGVPRGMAWRGIPPVVCRSVEVVNAGFLPRRGSRNMQDTVIEAWG